MKLRIKGNSIRLRLSQSEIASFQDKGIISDSIQFSPMEEDVLKYTIERAETASLAAMYDMDQIHIFVPQDQAMQWCTSNLVSMTTEMSIGENKSLNILIEKDFKCLKPRLNEDESDNFPNPHASHLMN